MLRFCGRIFAVCAIAFFVSVPMITYGALVPCEGAGCSTCHIVTTVNGVVKWLVQIMVVLAGLILAWAGFTMVTSGGSSEKISHAKEMMVNSLIGFIILLSAWLVVDTILKALVGETLPGYGPWNEIQCSTSPAAQALQSTAGPSSSTGAPTGVVFGTGSLVQCPAGNTSCNPSSLQSAGFTQQQANIMSCIAMTESSGNPSTPPYNVTNPGSNSSACGLFQVTRTTWNGLRMSGPCGDFSQCMNAQCNTQAALQLVQRNGYKDWLCPNCNSKAQGCINKFGG